MHTFAASGGIGAKTYTLAAAEGQGYFILNAASGLLSAAAAAVGVYTLSVKVSDSRGNSAQARGTVEVVEFLSLADAPSLEALARLSLTVSLHTFAAGGGYEAKRYTVIAGNKAGYFALDAVSGELSLPSNSAMLAGAYTLRVEASDGLITPQRATAAVTVRLAKNGIFVLGGDVGSNIYRNDVWWAVGGKNWRQEQENNEAGHWSVRRYHQAVSHQGRLYVLGGRDSGGGENDVWSSADGKSWRQEKAIDEQGWSKRFRHQAVRHQGLLYVLGGYDGDYRNDVWSSADGVSWTEETSAAEWSARANHQVVSHQGRLYVLGGLGGFEDYYNDVWSSADGVNWTAEAAAAWSARTALQAVSHQGRLYVLGGYDGDYYNDVWSSAFGETWRQEKADDGQGWSGRFRHQVVSRGGLLYVLGGAILNSLRNDVWSSADGRSWTKVTDAAWSVRRAHQAVVFPSPLVLVGLGEKIILTAGVALAELHTVTAQYGVGQYTYSLSGVTGFDIDEGSGVLSADGKAAVGGHTLTVWVEDEEGSQAQTAVKVDVISASTAALSAVERFAWGGSGGSRNDVGLSEHGDSGRREGGGLRRSQQAMRYQEYVLDGG